VPVEDTVFGRRNLLKACALLTAAAQPATRLFAAAPASGVAAYPYAVPAGRYPQPEFVRDALRLHFGSALLDKASLFRGWDEAIVAHGMVPGPIGKAQLTEFYTAVFTAFPDFRLVDDALLVAGDMGAHRYHALGTHTGGDHPTGEKIMLRGQTIYRVNAQGRVTWRISNHDHAFREAQIAFAATRRPAEAPRSWEPDPFAAEAAYVDDAVMYEPLAIPEPRIRRRLAEFMCALNDAASGSGPWGTYAPDAVIHGLTAGDPLAANTLGELQARVAAFRDAVPDLQVFSHELIVCGPYAIQQYYATGTRRDTSLPSGSTTGRLITRGETIYRFDGHLRIVEQWVNHDVAHLEAELR
jgi:hypothetical protein